MLESQQDTSTSDDAAAAAADLRRVGVVVYPLRLSPEGHEFDSRTRRHGAVAQLGEQYPCKVKVVGSFPTGSTIMIMKDTLWRSCSSSSFYRSRPGGTQRLQISEAEFNSLAACQLTSDGQVGKALDSKSRDRGFESRSEVH